MTTRLEDCFTPEGNLKFDPYRCDREDHRYQILFNENDNLNDLQALKKLIEKKKWTWDSVAVGLYHADIFAMGTKNNYSTIYYFR